MSGPQRLLTRVNGLWIVIRSSYDRTASWSGVEYLWRFLISNRSAGPYGHAVSAQEALPGDIVQLGTQEGRFYHSPVITAVVPQILVAAHSDDVLDQPLSAYHYEKVRFLHIDGVRGW